MPEVMMHPWVPGRATTEVRSRRRMSLRPSQPLWSGSFHPDPKFERSYPVFGALPLTGRLASWARTVPAAGPAAGFLVAGAAVFSVAGADRLRAGVCAGVDAVVPCGGACVAEGTTDDGGAVGASDQTTSGPGAADSVVTTIGPACCGTPASPHPASPSPRDPARRTASHRRLPSTAPACASASTRNRHHLHRDRACGCTRV